MEKRIVLVLIGNNEIPKTTTTSKNKNLFTVCPGSELTFLKKAFVVKKLNPQSEKHNT